MINNEYKYNRVVGGASLISTANTHQKQRKIKDRSSSISSIIEDIRRSDFQEHNVLTYPDLPSFRQVYSECTKQALDNNEIILNKEIVIESGPAPAT
ncbi:MAG: hypothetical protein M3M89_03365 [Thermoproteota archaeon]|nr:hypothetical protein [Thermoproteota archaeon]